MEKATRPTVHNTIYATLPPVKLVNEWNHAVHFHGTHIRCRSTMWHDGCLRRRAKTTNGTARSKTTAMMATTIAMATGPTSSLWALTEKTMPCKKLTCAVPFFWCRKEDLKDRKGNLQTF